MRPIRLATAWLSGCSGCHMSLLNLHHHLLELLLNCELVYSPLADIKEYPAGVDIALVEGAVGNADNRDLAALIRERTVWVVSLGDCAVNGNVSGLRNPIGREATLAAAYPTESGQHQEFGSDVPLLLPRVLPLHQVIRVDAFLPGCPPLPEDISRMLASFFKQPAAGG